MTDLREPDALSTGEVLADRYELLERIGEGGMGRVYRAYDTHLQRTVAVKVFRGTGEGIGSVERALSETTVLASVNHHGLVTVFDAHVSPDEVSYFVMEHVDGITLSELIARGPIDPAIVAAIASDLAEGLHVAHSAGIVHRDIKPSNVLLQPSPLPGRTWRAKLADFGIAYLRDSARVTTPGLLVGTAAYVAPEQARGAAPAPEADVYSFGIVLIEALTGRRPFADAEGIGTLVARLTMSPEVPDTLPDVWQGLLRGMTAMRPDDRPTALEVAIALAGTVASPSPDIAAAADIPTAPFEPPTTPTIAYPAAVAVPGSVSTPDTETQAIAPTPAASAASPATTSPADVVRRRRLIGAGVIGAVVLLAVILGSLWLSGIPVGGAEPTPTPTVPVAPVEEQPAPAPTEQTPVDDQVEDGGGDDTGEGNDNSGPGNNNGNGNGGGNGNGNENRGPGNNNGGNGNGND